MTSLLRWFRGIWTRTEPDREPAPVVSRARYISRGTSAHPSPISATVTPELPDHENYDGTLNHTIHGVIQFRHGNDCFSGHFVAARQEYEDSALGGINYPTTRSNNIINNNNNNNTWDSSRGIVFSDRTHGGSSSTTSTSGAPLPPLPVSEQEASRNRSSTMPIRVVSEQRVARREVHSPAAAPPSTTGTASTQPKLESPPRTISPAREPKRNPISNPDDHGFSQEYYKFSPNHGPPTPPPSVSTHTRPGREVHQSPPAAPPLGPYVAPIRGTSAIPVTVRREEPEMRQTSTVAPTFLPLPQQQESTSIQPSDPPITLQKSSSPIPHASTSQNPPTFSFLADTPPSSTSPKDPATASIFHVTALDVQIQQPQPRQPPSPEQTPTGPGREAAAATTNPAGTSATPSSRPSIEISHTLKYTSLRELWARPLVNGKRVLPREGPQCLYPDCERHLTLFIVKGIRNPKNARRGMYICKKHRWKFGTFADLEGEEEDESKRCECGKKSRRMENWETGEPFWKCLEMECEWRS